MRRSYLITYGPRSAEYWIQVTHPDAAVADGIAVGAAYTFLSEPSQAEDVALAGAHLFRDHESLPMVKLEIDPAGAGS